jgi:type IV secretion system protein VirB4
VIFFDRQRSSFNACLSVGGKAYDFSQGNGVSPLMFVGELGVDWAIAWLKHLLEAKDIAFTPELESQLKIAIRDHKTKQLRMSELKSFALGRDIQTVFANLENDPLLDSQMESIEWAPFTVFEGSGLFSKDQLKAELVLDFLFESVKRRIDGRPTLIIVDEAHAYLDSPLFAHRLDKWFAEEGKNNVAVVLATQYWKTFAESTAAKSLKNNSMTRICLQNADADHGTEDDPSYADAGLSDQQIAIVRDMRPKRHYFVMQKDRKGDGDETRFARVVDFGLSQKTLELVAKTDRDHSEEARVASEKDPNFAARAILDEPQKNEPNKAQARRKETA